VNWNWEPATWKRSTKLLLGMITIWPIIYMMLFFVLIFSGILIGVMFGPQAEPGRKRLDLIQLEKKVQGGEIRELKVTSDEIQSIDRGGLNYYTDVSNASTRDEIIRQAREVGSDGRPRVDKIDENASPPPVSAALPLAFFVLFGCHVLTIFLAFVLMPLYIILPLKNERLDQNMRIVWVVLACTIGMFSDPVYWYNHVWRTPAASQPPLTQIT
jgi:hypothetical protein